MAGQVVRRLYAQWTPARNQSPDTHQGQTAGKPVTKDQLTRREQWLSSKAVHPLPEVKKHCPICQRVHPFEFEHCPYDGSDLGIIPGKADRPAPGPGRRG